MKNIQGTTYSCEHENIEARKDYLCLFRNNKQWLEGLTESDTYLIRQMARFVLSETKGKGDCLTCRSWEQEDDGIAGQYKFMPASGKCWKKGIKTNENETCDIYEET